MSLASEQEADLAELDEPEIKMSFTPEIAAGLPAEIPEMPSTKMPIEGGAPIAGIVPRNIDEAWRLSQAFVRAKMVPESYKGANDQETTAKIMLGLMKGLEVGLAPVSAISTIMIINQRPSIWGDGAIALVQRSGTMEYCKESLTGTPFTDDWKATCEVKRAGQEPVTKTFSWADALKAGLTNKGPWKQYPQRMIQMRARSWALRDVFADCLNGLSIVEEARDIPTKAKPVDASSLDD